MYIAREREIIKLGLEICYDAEGIEDLLMYCTNF